MTFVFTAHKAEKFNPQSISRHSCRHIDCNSLCCQADLNAMVPPLEDLKDDHNLWSRCTMVKGSFRRRANQLPSYRTAAFDALDHWHASPTSEADSQAGGAIDGAFNVIGHSIEVDSTIAYSTCRRVADYFSSRNINSAFGAIRRFEYPVFSRFTIFVADKLIAVATLDAPTPSPIEMTVRGIAFRSLFELDPQYKHWSQLAVARDECVHGLLTWGASGDGPGSSRNRQLAARIMRYVERAT